MDHCVSVYWIMRGVAHVITCSQVWVGLHYQITLLEYLISQWRREVTVPYHAVIVYVHHLLQVIVV